MHDLAHAEPVNDIDGEHGDAGGLHPAALFIVDIPAADLDAVPGVHKHRPLAKVHHTIGAVAADRRKGHTVHIAGEGALLVVPIAMGVDPDDAQAAPGGKMSGGSRHTAGGDAVVTAQGDGKMTAGQTVGDGLEEVSVHVHHLCIIPQVRQALPLGQGHDIATVMDGMTQVGQAFAKAAVTDGHGAHGHPSFGSAQVHLDADDIQFAHSAPPFVFTLWKRRCDLPSPRRCSCRPAG